MSRNEFSFKDVVLYCLICVVIGITMSYIYWVPKYNALGIQSLKKEETVNFKEFLIASQRKTIDTQRVLIELLLEAAEEKEKKKVWSSYEEARIACFGKLSN